MPFRASRGETSGVGGEGAIDDRLIDPSVNFFGGPPIFLISVHFTQPDLDDPVFP
jgi:hypothetical protein